ncbi:hypothetical protein M405DRAFT_879897 [Rhizopogon salebrosus TDB-379]|nr:hypothetical protein M405DRAFT_879897 [Rhizopogon salebrosus TDB-379]
MPSASLQSRIKAYEALADKRPLPPSHTTTSAHVISLKPPQPKYPPYNTNLLESPISPTSDSFYPIAPYTPPKSSSRSPSPSPPNLGRKTSLIDLKDWIVDDGPNEAVSAVSPHIPISNGKRLKGIREFSKTPPPIVSKPAIASSTPISSAPLINFESPPKSRPPLPPRKPSYSSTDSISICSVSDSSATLRPPGHPDSLSVEHTYPPALTHAFGAVRMRHAPGSSISSFHSVSLSSDGNELKPPSPRLSTRSSPGTIGGSDGSVDGDVVSIADSFENVSVTSAISPTTTIPFDWEKALSKASAIPRPQPPKLPQRPGTKPPPMLSSISRSVSTSSTSTTTTRRPAPLPPPASHQSLSRAKLPSSRTSLASTSASTSDRSSILSLSDATTTSRTSTSTRNSGQLGHSASLLLRPTPVPSAARTRYETLFVSTVITRRKAEKDARKAKPKSLSLTPSPAKKGRQAAGWRGLSVDLITNPDDHPILSLQEEDDNEDDDAKEDHMGLEERLGGRIVKLIWNASKLDRQKLQDIWKDCEPSSIGSLDREAFVKGMWRIDEELRRAQLSRRTSALSAASSQRIPHRPKNASNPKLILQ